MAIPDQILVRVTFGAVQLDKHSPGWWRRIDTDVLDMADPWRCILGQLYGNFLDAPIGDRAALLGFGALAQNFGSDMTAVEFTEAMNTEYEQLRDAWLQVIAERLAAEKAVTS